MSGLKGWFLLALVALPYLRLAESGWAWDDYGLLLNNEVLQNPGWENIWQRDLWCCVHNKDTSTAYYRPLTTLSFLLDYQLGLRPNLAHLHSLFWHLLSVFLLFRLLIRPLGENRALAGALIFGLHPIQSEAVAWISARNDLLATAGVLGTLLSLEWRWPAAIFCTLFACLSKESAFLLPAFLLFWRLAFSEAVSLKKILMEQLLLVPGLALAFAFRSMATLGTPPDSRVAVDSLIQSIASTLLTLGGWLSIPWPLTTTMTIYNTDFRPQLWLGALVTGLVLLRLLRQAPLRASALLGMAALAFAPALGGISWYGTLGERYLYLPMVALASLLAAELPDWSGKLLLPWSIGALGILLVRLPDWDSSESLWQAAVTRAPDAYSYQLQASEFYRQGRYPEALATYEHSLNLRPTRLFACTYITSTAIEVLSLDDLLARLPSWEASGCRTIQGFDTPAVMAMAAAGRWINAEAWLRSAHQVDPKKRDRIIKGAIALVDGDLLMLGGEYVIWKGSPSDYLDKVYSYTNNRKIRP